MSEASGYGHPWVYRSVPLALGPFRAGRLWHHAGPLVGAPRAYVVARMVLSETAKHEGIYQADGTPVVGRVEADGPTIVELALDRAEWADRHPVEQAFDPWAGEALRVVTVHRHGWRMLQATPAPLYWDTSVPDSTERPAPGRWALTLMCSPDDDHPAVQGSYRIQQVPPLRPAIPERPW